MQWVNRALDRVHAEAATGPGRASMGTPDWKATRWALRTAENKLTDDKRALVQPDRRHQSPHRPDLDTQGTNCATSTASTIHPTAPANICAAGSPSLSAAA